MVQIPILRRFKWFRRWRGGRWARVTALLCGEVWFQVGPSCVERTEEDWRDPKSMWRGATSECGVARVLGMARELATRLLGGHRREPGA